MSKRSARRAASAAKPARARTTCWKWKAIYRSSTTTRTIRTSSSNRFWISAAWKASSSSANRLPSRWPPSPTRKCPAASKPTSRQPSTTPNGGGKANQAKRPIDFRGLGHFESRYPRRFALIERHFSPEAIGSAFPYSRQSGAFYS